jgi:drug/metabolite transporter (DMT)-like permease
MEALSKRQTAYCTLAGNRPAECRTPVSDDKPLGQLHVTPGFAGVSMAAVGLIILPLAHVFIPGKKMTLRRFVGFAIGFAVVLILIGEQAFVSTGSDLEWLGRLACFMAASCYACSAIITRRIPPIDQVGLVVVPLIIGALYTSVFPALQEGPPPLIDKNTLIAGAALGLIPTTCAAFIRVFIIRGTGPVFLSLANYQVPLWSVILGIVLLAEPFQVNLVIAMALILFGLGLSQYGALKRLFKSHSPDQMSAKDIFSSLINKYLQYFDRAPLFRLRAER